MATMKTNVSCVLQKTEREALREAFLAREGFADIPLSPLPADCSKRRYFRLPNMLLMDAPPPHESTVSFQSMADFLADAGLSVPRIYASDHTHGFLLVEDLGELTFRKAIEKGFSETLLYGEVIQSLIHLHQNVTVNTISLPSFDLELFLNGTEVFLDWYGPFFSEQQRQDFQGLWTEAYHQQPTVPHSLVMRDVMVDNLLWLPSRTGFNRCGFIDFQDGVWGPVTYDLVSHLQDGRRDIPSQFAQERVEQYLKALPELHVQDFWSSYTLWGAQLSTRLAGLFHRLSKRDGKPQYLVHLPRVKAALERNLSHPSLKAIWKWFQWVEK